MSQEPATRNEKRETKFTRRQLAIALSTSAIVLAQTPPPPPLPQNPDEELKTVRDAIHQNAEQLAKVEVPMSTEPAVHFRA
ncbi:MAG TPA: hypothetical protein VKT81_21880 [Bryobacteraceae bacterium]|nr:hypothetical protein [Bryobacteraceae bacterium]